MSTDRNDEDLRAAFGRLAREDATAIPRFDLRGHAAVRATRIGARWYAVGGALAFAGATVVFVVSRGQTDSPVATPDVVWRAPSDFLLATPGRELLRTVPAIEVLAFPSITTVADESRDSARSPQ